MKFKPLISKPIVYGKINHDVFDAITKNQENIISSVKTSDLNKIKEIYREEYTKILKDSISNFEDEIIESKIDKEKLFNKSLKIFLDKVDDHAKNLKLVIDNTGLLGDELLNSIPERSISEVKLSSRKLRVKGVVDRIEIIEGNHVPVEIKTGKMPSDGVWPNHKIQLAAYIMLIKEKFKSRYGFLEYIDFNIRRKVVMNPFLEEEVEDMVEEVHEFLESGDMPKYCKNANKCEACNFKNNCF